MADGERSRNILASLGHSDYCLSRSSLQSILVPGLVTVGRYSLLFMVFAWSTRAEKTWNRTGNFDSGFDAFSNAEIHDLL